MARAFDNQIQNRNFLAPVGFKFTLAKEPKISFFCNSARIPEITLGNSVQPTYLKDIDIPGDEGVMLGVSSRGIGSIKEDTNGVKVVGEDFMLATAADIVADPSAPDAFVSGIMEGKEWIWEGGILREQLAKRTQQRINTLVVEKRLEEHKLELFNNFLSNL